MNRDILKLVSLKEKKQWTYFIQVHVVMLILKRLAYTTLGRSLYQQPTILLPRLFSLTLIVELEIKKCKDLQSDSDIGTELVNKNESWTDEAPHYR